MKFKIYTWNLKKLISLQEAGDLNLNPPYQRGDIWTPIAKRKLIGSIKLSYPLPAFFLSEVEEGKYEMVDGQQRTRAILGYHKGYFLDENKCSIQETNQKSFYEDYEIAVCVLKNTSREEVEDFYYRVNKFGTKLNRPEINKAYYYNKPQQQLVERLSDNEEFSTLQLFTDSSLNRMNDADLVAELLTLQMLGNTDKKIQVDKKFYENDDFTELQARELEEQFIEILVHIQRFDNIYPIKKTRYRQRNDFYTVYGFLKENKNLNSGTLDYFYKILVLIGEDIYPSNEECFSFKEYADNCVSQSNSKKARDERSDFLKKLLLNKDSAPLEKSEDDPDANLVIMDSLNFYKLQNSDLSEVEGYWILSIDSLQTSTKRDYFNHEV